MPKYYTAKEDPEGDFVTVNHVRYSVTGIDPSRIHIPAGREADIDLYDTQAEFLAAMGLEPAAGHTFPPPTAEELVEPKAVKSSQIEAEYEAFLAGGITIDDVTLAAGDKDRAFFTEGLVLLREAGTPQTEPQTIVDIDGNPVTLQLGQLRTLLVTYGGMIQTAWTARATRLAAVKAATTLEEIDAV